MSISNYNQKIYLVCRGTNCNDIIKTINSDSYLSGNSLKSESYSRLDEVGLKEIFMLINSTINKEKLGLLNPSGINAHILSSLDYAAIESGLIMYYELSDQVKLYPVPFLSNKSGIYNQRDLDKIKELFGKERNLSKKYWNKKTLNSSLHRNILSLKTKVPEIDWKFTNETIRFRSNSRNQNIKISRSSLNSFQFANFKKDILYPLIRESIEGGGGTELKPIVIICNYETIEKMFDDMTNRDKSLSSKYDKVENGSIWSVDMSISRMMSVGKWNYTYRFNDRSKVYPTEYNSSDLRYNSGDDTFHYEFKNRKYRLVEANKTIPIEVAINMECKNCKEARRMENALKKIYNGKFPNSEKSKNNNNRMMKKNVSTLSGIADVLIPEEEVYT